MSDDNEKEQQQKRMSWDDGDEEHLLVKLPGMKDFVKMKDLMKDADASCAGVTNDAELS